MNEQEIIKSVKFIFDAYKDLEVLPLFAWGRYYKYELAGSPFEVDDYQFGDFHGIEIKDKRFNKKQWELLDEIDKVKDQEFQCKLEGIIYPDREDCVKETGFDDRGGMVLYIAKCKDGGLSIDMADCNSPE